MATSIKVNINDINEALKKLHLIHSEVAGLTGKIHTLSFSGSCNSTGYSSSAMIDLTDSSLLSVCKHLDNMINTTIEVLDASKTEFITKDEAIAKGLLITD